MYNIIFILIYLYVYIHDNTRDQSMSGLMLHLVTTYCDFVILGARTYICIHSIASLPHEHTYICTTLMPCNCMPLHKEHPKTN